MVIAAIFAARRAHAAGLAEVLGLRELVLILAEGSMTTNWAP